jgi:hypothetical protein
VGGSANPEGPEAPGAARPAGLDSAAWEILTERFGGLSEDEALLRGLDGEFEKVPGVIGNALRVTRLVPSRPPLEIVIDDLPRDDRDRLPRSLDDLPDGDLSPEDEVAYNDLRRRIEATASDIATEALTNPIEQKDLAGQLGVAEQTITRHVRKVRKVLREARPGDR